jgi:hypothetical protein
MKWTAYAIFLISVLALAAGGQEKPTQQSSILMAKKLVHAQGILEGLATKDFEMIARHAKIMNTFTELEKWFRSDLPNYDVQLRMFRQATDELIRQAKAENLEGATLANVQLTLGCVSCHKTVRDQRR